MDRTAPIATLTVPLGGQTVEMHPMDYPAGSLPLLRVRIREGKRFTVFDIDPETARRWGAALLDWGNGHAGGPR